jgi:hypothetical protein
MSKQFFYVQLKFTPKTGIEVTKTKHEAVVEVPKELAQRKRPELTDDNLMRVIALDLARRVALGALPAVGERREELYDEDPPIWYEERPRVMNERPCDNEENGTRAWSIRN